MGRHSREKIESPVRTDRSSDADLMLQILSHVRDVVILLSRDRQLRFANPAAEQLLARRDPLRLSRGRLTATSMGHARALERAIDGVCSRGVGEEEILVLRGTASLPLVLSIRCVDPASGETILVIASDAHVEPALVHATLRRCFGLTPSEAEVAAGLAAGNSSGHIAACRGVRVNTIRSQIKSIAAKLGCATQSQISTIVRTTPLLPDVPE